MQGHGIPHPERATVWCVCLDPVCRWEARAEEPPVFCPVCGSVAVEPRAHPDDYEDDADHEEGEIHDDDAE